MSDPLPTPPSAPNTSARLAVGFLLVVIGSLSYFLFFYKFPLTRDFPWVNLPLVLLGLWLSWTGLRHSWREAPLLRKGGSVLAFCFSMLLGTFFLYYIFYFSYQIPEVSSETEQLSEAPDLVLTDHLGEPVALTDFKGSPLVISVYRGYW